MTNIITNSAGLTAQLHAVNKRAAFERVSSQIASGARINSASDDAAGLAISNKLVSQLAGYQVAMKNGADAVGLIDTALAGTSEGIAIAHRIRDLAVQMSTGTYSDGDRINAQYEVNNLILELERITSETRYNGIKLLDGSFDQTMRLGNGNDELLQIIIDSPLTLTGIAVSQTAVGESEKILRSVGDVSGTSTFNTPAALVASITEYSGGVSGSSAKNLAESNTASGDSVFDYLPTTFGAAQSAFDTPSTSNALGVSAIDIISNSEIIVIPGTVNNSSNVGGRSTLDVKAEADANGPSSLDYLSSSSAQAVSSIASGVPNNNDAEVAVGGASSLNPLRFENGDFSAGVGASSIGQSGTVVSIEGWDIHLKQVALGTNSTGSGVGDTIGGYNTPIDAGGSDDVAATSYDSNPVTFSYEIQNNQITLATNEVNIDSYGKIHGPYIVAKEAISLNPDDEFSFTWEATGDGGDATDVYAYLLNTETGSTIELEDYTSAGPGAVAPQTVSHTMAAGTAGLYKFVFVSGAYDADGGGVVGSEVRLGNVTVTENSNASTTTTASVSLKAQEANTVRIQKELLTQLATIAGVSNNYQISGADGSLFEVDPGTGNILSSGPLLRSAKTNYTFDIRFDRAGGGYHIETVNLELTQALGADTLLSAQESDRVDIDISKLGLLNSYFESNPGGDFSIDPSGANAIDFTIDPLSGDIQSNGPLDFLNYSPLQFDVIYELDDGTRFVNAVTLNLTDTLTSTATLTAEEAIQVNIDPSIFSGTSAYNDENPGSVTLGGNDSDKFDLLDGIYVSNQPLLLAEQESYSLQLLHDNGHVENISLTLTEALQSSANLSVKSGSVATIDSSVLENITKFAESGPGEWSLKPGGDSGDFSIDSATGEITSNGALAEQIYSLQVSYIRNSDNEEFIETITLDARPANQGLTTIKAEEADNFIIKLEDLEGNVQFLQDNQNAYISGLSGPDAGRFEINSDGDIVATNTNVPNLTRGDVYNLEESYEFTIEFRDDNVADVHFEEIRFIVTEALQSTSILTAHESGILSVQKEALEQLDDFAARDRYRGTYSLEGPDEALFQFDESKNIVTIDTLDFDDRSTHNYNFTAKYEASDGRIFSEAVSLTLTDTVTSTATVEAEVGDSLQIALSQLTSSENFKTYKPGGTFVVTGADSANFEYDNQLDVIRSTDANATLHTVNQTYDFNLEYQINGSTAHTEAVALTLKEALQSVDSFEAVEADRNTIYLDSLSKLRSFASRDGMNGVFDITGADADLFEFSELGNIQTFGPLGYTDRADHTYNFNVEYKETDANGGDTFVAAVTLVLSDTLSATAVVTAEEGSAIDIGIETFSSSKAFSENHSGGAFSLDGDGAALFDVDPGSGNITLKDSASPLLFATHPSVDMELVYEVEPGGALHRESITLNIIGATNGSASAVSAEAGEVKILINQFEKLNSFVSSYSGGSYNITGQDSDLFIFSDDGNLITKEALDFNDRSNHSYQFNVEYFKEGAGTFSQAINLVLTDTFSSTANIYAEEAGSVEINLTSLNSSNSFKANNHGGFFSLGGVDATKFNVNEVSGLITSKSSTVTKVDVQDTFNFDLIYSKEGLSAHVEAIKLTLTDTTNKRSQTAASVVEADSIKVNLSTLSHMKEFAFADGYAGQFMLQGADSGLFSIAKDGTIESRIGTVIDFDAGARTFHVDVIYNHSNAVDVYRDSLTINIENDSVDDGGLEYAEFDLTSVVRASATVTNTDDMLNRIIATQSSLGANKNAIDSNLQRLSHSSVALYSAKSRISDLNVASATADLVKLDLLNKSAMAMISQTSSSIEKLAKLLLR